MPGIAGRLDEAVADSLERHAVICGYGRVGRLIGPALERRGFRYVVITQQRAEIDRLRARGVPAIFGDASNPVVLQTANIATARLVVVATPDPDETRLIVERALALHPGIDFVVRTHNDHEAARLRALSDQDPGDPRRARARGPDGALFAAPLRGQRNGSRSDRPGPARPLGRRGDSGAAGRWDPGLAGRDRDSSGDRRRRLGVRPRRSRVHQHRPLVRDDRLVALVEASGPDAGRCPGPGRDPDGRTSSTSDSA